MPTAADAKSTKPREKIAEIQRTISAMEYPSSGTLLKRLKICGNPRCHCASDPAARHGPYFEWSYLKAGSYATARSPPSRPTSCGLRSQSSGKPRN